MREGRILYNMFSRPAILLALAAALIATAPAFAAKRPYTPEELAKEAEAIIFGKVQSFRMKSRVMEGEERTRVTLDVVVESVEKGSPGDPGKVVQVECDRLTRVSPFGLPTHQGNESIPAAGSRAKFFLAGNTALAPNGIEVLDGGAELNLPMKSALTAFMEWPLIVAPIATVFLVAWLIWMLSKKRKPAVV
jgi:hypothetical protein